MKKLNILFLIPVLAILSLSAFAAPGKKGKNLPKEEMPKSMISAKDYEKAKKTFVINTVNNILTSTYIRRGETDLDNENLLRFPDTTSPIEFDWENMDLKNEQLLRFLKSRTEMLSSMYDAVPEPRSETEATALVRNTVEKLSETLIKIELIQESYQIANEAFKKDLEEKSKILAKNARYLLDLAFVTSLKTKTESLENIASPEKQIRSLKRVRALFYTLILAIPVGFHFTIPDHSWYISGGEFVFGSIIGSILLDTFYRNRINSGVLKSFEVNRDRNLLSLARSLERQDALSPLFGLNMSKDKPVDMMTRVVDSMLPSSCVKVLSPKSAEENMHPNKNAEIEQQLEYEAEQLEAMAASANAKKVK